MTRAESQNPIATETDTIEVVDFRYTQI